MSTKTIQKPKYTTQQLLHDYRIVCESREASLLGRKEVFMGKAKFGIFGDGKEVAQIAMAKIFKKGDFRSGYYRDQTFMLAIGKLTLEQYFAQLYAHTDEEAEPASAGRLMNSHFATRMLDQNGLLKKLTESYNISADLSPTAAQMPRLLGLAWASKLFRNNSKLKKYKNLSINGNEIAFGTIGNASTSEGMFWETLNAAGVLQVPLIMSVWDDNYGISVPNEYHTTRGSISKALSGFQRSQNNEKGFEILTVRGWEFENLLLTYEKAEQIARKKHVPVLIHVQEMTQPQGHSTSGSHERYKSKERLAWEDEFDCIQKMRTWMLQNKLAKPEQLNEIEKNAKITAKNAKNAAWKAFTQSMKADHNKALELLSTASEQSQSAEAIASIKKELQDSLNPIRLDAVRAIKKALRLLRNENLSIRSQMIDWLKGIMEQNQERYSSHLYSQSKEAALNVPAVEAQYPKNPKLVDGREILQACFDAALQRDPLVLAFGEDVGKIGDVNQGMAGLQEKYGEVRVSDTGIRECTIVGQGIGAAMRGMRPIAEVQYLDYLLYAIQTLSDDLATLQYRTKGGQKAPLIIRTRGHRLEGVWHSGSPMGMILNSLRGIYVLTPRNMTQAAGFYNTLLQSDDPALVIESLNGYRLKENMPDNIGEFTIPLGQPEILRSGTDITILTYGSMCRIVLEAAEQLEHFNISCEVIDAQTLLPFDINHSIVESLKKTNRIIFADEDVPGGASAYMMQQVLEKQGGYQYLDAQPVTITGKDHRPAYASDGDYFSKPNTEDIFDQAYALLHESDPKQFPALY